MSVTRPSWGHRREPQAQCHRREDPRPRLSAPGVCVHAALAVARRRRGAFAVRIHTAMEKFFLRALGRSYTYCCAEATPPLPVPLPQRQPPPPPTSGRTSAGGRRSADVGGPAVLRSKASSRHQHARSSPRKRREFGRRPPLLPYVSGRGCASIHPAITPSTVKAGIARRFISLLFLFSLFVRR